MAKRGFFMYWFTPLGRMRDAASSLSDAARASKERIAAMGPKPAEDLSDEDVRKIEDAQMRFEAIYEMNRWTEHELSKQRRAVNVGKITSLALASVVFVVSLGMIMFAVPMVQMFVLPIGILLTVLSLAQAFRHALYEAQIDKRSLMDAKAFLAMPDFWSRLLK